MHLFKRCILTNVTCKNAKCKKILFLPFLHTTMWCENMEPEMYPRVIHYNCKTNLNNCGCRYHGPGHNWGHWWWSHDRRRSLHWTSCSSSHWSIDSLCPIYSCCYYPWNCGWCSNHQIMALCGPPLNPCRPPRWHNNKCSPCTLAARLCLSSLCLYV